MSGELNGTSVHLRMKINDIWVYIGGQKTHTESIAHAAIDITSKDSNQFRTLLNSEGLKTDDISSEFVFSSDEAFEALNVSAKDGQIEEFDVIRGSEHSVAFMKVISVARTSADGEAVTAAISLQSSAAFDIGQAIVGQVPVANFTFVPTLLSVVFTDTSTDGDGTVDNWFWDFGDDSTSTLQNPTNVYAISGTYQVKLSISDDDGNSDDVIKEVTVSS